MDTDAFSHDQIFKRPDYFHDNFLWREHRLLGDFHLSLNVFDPHDLVGTKIPQVARGLLYVHCILKYREKILVFRNLAKDP